MRLAEFVSEAETRIGDMVLSSTDKMRIAKQAMRKWAADNPPITHKTVSYAGANYIDLPSDVKKVIKVYPSSGAGTIGTAEEFLFGFTPLPKATGTYFARLQYLQTLRSLGSSRRFWKQIGDKLYVDDVASGVSSLTLVYYQAIDPEADPDITDPGDCEWLINYTTALMKLAEGTRLRKASMLGVDTDADQLVSDGKEEKEALEAELDDDQMPFPILRHSGG